MKFFFNKILITIISLLLSSCGFKPLYNNLDNCSELGKIEIIQPISRELQYLHNALINTIPVGCQSKTKKYKLQLLASHNLNPIMFIKTGDATRLSIKVVVNYQLIDSNFNSLTSSTVSSIASFNSLDSPFNDYISQDYYLKNAMQIAANKIIYKLQKYFNSDYENRLSNF